MTNFFKKNNKKINSADKNRGLKSADKNRGFTLVEMLVSVGLFAIVVTITMGTIVTIIDIDRKARSLTLIIDNMNFALESITRDIKTADPNQNFTLSSGKDEISFENADGEQVTYVFLDLDNGNGNRILAKSVGPNDPIPVIAENVNLFDNSRFELTGPYQPFVRIILEGEVNLSEKTKTNFNIQTSVSVRELNLSGPTYPSP